MTASKDPDNPWVAAVTSIPGCGQPLETLHLWNCSWTTKAPQIHITALTHHQLFAKSTYLFFILEGGGVLYFDIT